MVGILGIYGAQFRNQAIKIKRDSTITSDALSVRGVQMYNHISSSLQLISVFLDGVESTSTALVDSTSLNSTAVTFNIAAEFLFIHGSHPLTFVVFMGIDVALQTIMNSQFTLTFLGKTVPLGFITIQVYEWNNNTIKTWGGLYGSMIFDPGAPGTVFSDELMTVDGTAVSGGVVRRSISNEGEGGCYLLPESAVNTMTYNVDATGLPYLDGWILFSKLNNRPLTFLNRVFWFIMGRKVWTPINQYWILYSTGVGYQPGSFAFSTPSPIGTPSYVRFSVWPDVAGVAYNLRLPDGVVPSATNRTLWMVQMSQEGAHIVVRVRASGMTTTMKNTISNRNMTDASSTHHLRYSHSTETQLYKFALTHRWHSDTEFDDLFAQVLSENNLS